MARSDNSTSWVNLYFLLFVLTIVVTGLASAAVTGDFSSEYDGYNDGTDTDVRGHEIQVSGTLEFSGENAVNPRITIRPAEHTVLDDSSVELLQPGDTSVNFEKQYVEQGIRYSAQEIPSGSEYEIQFVVYPVSGLSNSEIKSADVVVRYERPSGGTERSVIDVSTPLNNTPPQVISSQESSENMNIAIQGLAVIGGLTVAIVVLMGIYSVVSGGGGPPNPRSRN